MTPLEILDTLSIKMYEQPWSNLKDSLLKEIPLNPICVAMLLIDFETEVAMNGIMNFIGNSSGRYLDETISSLREVSCNMEADTLSKIRAITSNAGMTHEAIQSERSGCKEYSVTSFSQLHGEKCRSVSKEAIEYCQTIDFGHVMDQLLDYVGSHQEVFQKSLLT